jgi:hypothetical protein
MTRNDNIADLPNYFLADLPGETALTGTLITEACQTLKRNREQYLQRRSTSSLIRVLSETAQNWLDPDYRFRRMALRVGPGETGFSEAVLARGMDAFFRRVTAENLEALLRQELGHEKRLDDPASSRDERAESRAALAIGPDLLVHVAAGNIPSPALHSMLLGLLVRSAQFVKCATGGSLLPRLFAHSLYEVEPKLGACLEVAAWRGGNETLEKPLFAEADCVTATGTDETLAAVRARLPARVRFIGHGHRVSFGYVTQEALSGHDVRDLAARAARDIAGWDQLGCLSPHVYYVERDGHVGGAQFAALLAEELERLEQSEPRGHLAPEAAAAIATRRAVYQTRAAHFPGTRHWCSENSTAWTVVFETDPHFQISCLNRFIYVKEVGGLTDVINGVDLLHGQVSTVGLAAPPHQMAAIVSRLARWGVSRICPIGQMQDPPLGWRHDGRPPLAELVRWVDWEQE